MLCVFLYVFVWLFSNFFFVFHKNKKKIEKYRQCVFVHIGSCVLWMAIETKIFKFCISCSLDKHLNAQLSKWVLWLVFVMSTIKIVSYISYLYHSFWRERLENPITRKSLKKCTNNHVTTKACQSWITSVFLGTAKLGCFSLHNWVFSFLSLICLCMLCLKRKICKEN